ncbi:MGMT family protein [Streptomonospora salina]|uniref:Alkylated DNA nucleotide flippase Atl1 n=1 Tax=Streptomonospora salina TaxID=104205 RepID=A0A841EDU3_9ACTN|nr:MGMT family protein [Streptomonospora salina]MBB5999509.1 alkylated DNA nucleotide flippase Atl1 [Streptomonospora salina]
MPHAFTRHTAYVERVLEVAEAIPVGMVMGYGDIAEYLGEGGPRQVGSVMSAWGGAVCWWRVIRSDGRPPPGHEVEALQHYAAEATPMRPAGDRVDMRRARWDGAAPPEHTDVRPEGRT